MDSAIVKFVVHITLAILIGYFILGPAISWLGSVYGYY